jgi:hypothetical protein
LSKYKIGYEKLNVEEKEAYRLFEKAFLSYARVIDCGSISKDVDLLKVLRVALNDNPQTYYFSTEKIEVCGSIFGDTRIRFREVYSLSKIKKMEKEMGMVLKEALEKILLLNPISNYDKLMCIYEYLQDNIEYDSMELEARIRFGKIRNSVSYNAYGALVLKTAVCDGIAAAFSILAQHMGVRCSVIDGDAVSLNAELPYHAWNIINIRDKYYHADVTWDIGHKKQTGEYSYEYFCVTDDVINNDHNWNINETPACNSDELSFYVRNKCYANNLTQLEDIFRRYAKSKYPVVRVRISDKIEIPEPNDRYIVQCLEDISDTVGRTDGFQYMWNKDTRCFYAKYE